MKLCKLQNLRFVRLDRLIEIVFPSVTFFSGFNAKISSFQPKPVPLPWRLRFLTAETSDADRLRFQVAGDRIRAVKNPLVV